MNTKPRKHCELIKAWADGAEIVQRDSYGNWNKFFGSWCDNVEYKVLSRTFAFRLALCKTLDLNKNSHLYSFSVSKDEEYDETTDKEFVCWLTDWIEVEDE